MPDWTAPFHLPKLTDEEYARQKAEYIAKNGYTITIPGLSDIIKIRTEQPMTALEHYWWKRKEWDKFGPVRLEECRKQKQKRKERYLAMLGSPTPAVVANAGSIMTAIDDMQDATNTLAALGSLARYVAPRVLGKLLRTPVGLLMTTSDLLNMVQSTAMYCMAPMYGKKGGEELARGSPKTIKMKLKKRMWSTAKLPTKSDYIQGLQTTNEVFGFGISLGPIVGLMQDIIFGSVRTTFKKAPKIKFPVPDLQYWYKAAQTVVKSAGVMFGFPHYTDDADVLHWITTVELAFQHLFEITQEWHPLDMIEDIEGLEIRAPEPWHTLTQEVINAGPVAMEDVIGWPGTNTLWANVIELSDRTQPIATDNLNRFLERNKHSWTGYVGGLCAVEASGYFLACMENEMDVSYDHSMALKAATTMLKYGCSLDPNQPYEKFELFAAFLDDCEATLWNPTMANIVEFCFSSWNDIKLTCTAYPVTPP